MFAYCPVKMSIDVLFQQYVEQTKMLHFTSRNSWHAIDKTLQTSHLKLPSYTYVIYHKADCFTTN